MGFSLSIGSCFMVSGTETMLEVSTVFFQCTILLLKEILRDFLSPIKILVLQVALLHGLKYIWFKVPLELVKQVR